MKATEGVVAEAMAPATQNIYMRRAVRRYQYRPVEREMIEQVIDAGRMAPTAMMKQPWKFYILTEKASIEEFSKEIIRTLTKDMIHEGPSGIAKLALGALYSMYHGNLLSWSGYLLRRTCCYLYYCA